MHSHSRYTPPMMRKMALLTLGHLQLRIYFNELRHKRPRLADRGFVFHSDKIPAVAVADIQRLEIPPFSLNLVLVDVFLFPHVKVAFEKKCIKLEGIFV